MHVGLQPLQPFLMRDAEMLLLVDDDQAEIAEGDALRQQRMRADHDIDVAARELLLGLLRVLGEVKRDSCAIRTGKPAKRSENVR